jgi:hypothetical protein
MPFCDGARRIPSSFKVLMSGATNSGCSSCASFNTEYVLVQSGAGCDEFVVSIPGSPCGYDEAAVVLTDNDGVFAVQFELRNVDTTKIIYISADVIDLLCGTIDLAFDSGAAACNWPTKVSLVAIPPDISELASSTYISPPGSAYISPFKGSIATPGQFPKTSGPMPISPEEGLL